MFSVLYWHDYETFGVDLKRDRPAPFAGLRTDEALNEVGEPLVMPLVGEPGNNNLLVYDLRQDLSPFLVLDLEGLRDRLFTRGEDFPEGVKRLPVKP